MGGKRPYSSTFQNIEETEGELDSDLKIDDSIINHKESNRKNNEEKPIKKKRKYSQKLKPIILTEYTWATESKKGVSFAYCKACKIDLSIASNKVELN